MRQTYRKDEMQNPARYTPTFYGVNRKERLKKYVAEVNGKGRKTK